MKIKWFLIMILNCIVFATLFTVFNVALLNGAITRNGTHIISFVFGGINGIVISALENRDRNS